MGRALACGGLQPAREIGSYFSSVIIPVYVPGRIQVLPEPDPCYRDALVAFYEDRDKLPAARALLERAVSRYPDNEPFARELALLKFKRWRDCPGALEALSRFESKTSEPDTLNALALFQTCLGHRAEAIGLFERSLALKRDQPAVIQSLNMVRRGI